MLNDSIRAKLIRRLKKLAPAQTESTKLVTQIHDQAKDYPSHVNSRLYEVMERTIGCGCPAPGGPERNAVNRHEGYLELTDAFVEGESYIPFTTLFRPAANHQRSHWMEFKISVTKWVVNSHHDYLC